MSDWTRIDLNTEPDVVINLTMFLDKSGSMSKDWDKTTDAVVEYFQGLTEQPRVKYNTTLVTFADTSNYVFKNQQLRDIDYDKIRSMRANGISTSLFDSVCTELKNIPDEEVANLIIIFTDGKDNSSKTYDSGKMSELRESLEKKGNYTFVFLGANPDVWEEAKASAASNNARVFGRDKIVESMRGVRASTNLFSQRLVRASMSTDPILKSVRSVKNFYEEDLSDPNE